MLAKMIDKIVSLKETKTFEIGGQTYTDGHLTRIPPHVDRPEAISVSGLDGVCKLIRTELEKVGTTIMVQAKSYKSVEVMTTYLSDFSRNILYRAEADAPGIYTGFRSATTGSLPPALSVGPSAGRPRSTGRRSLPSPDFGPSVPTAACVAPPASDSSTPAAKRRKKTMNENRNNSGTAGGIGFCGLLTIAFIILKLTGVISWSWLWVLAPIWIPTAIVLAVLLVVLIVVLVKEGVKQTEERQRRELRSENIDEQARRYGLERQPGESDLELKKRIAFLKQAERRDGRR